MDPQRIHRYTKDSPSCTNIHVQHRNHPRNSIKQDQNHQSNGHRTATTDPFVKNDFMLPKGQFLLRYLRCKTHPTRNVAWEQETGLDVGGVSAIERFARITELLEHALHFLPPKDLIRSRQVDRRFRRLVDTSPKLQRAAFLTTGGLLNLEPSAGDDNQFPAWILDRSKSSVSTIPFAPRDFYQHSGSVLTKGHWFGYLSIMEDGGDFPLLVFPIALNPALEIDRHFSWSYSICDACEVSRLVPYHMRHSTQYDHGAWSGYLPGRGSMFWRMYATQPATTVCDIVVAGWGRCGRYTASGSEKWRSETVSSPTGLTMADLLRQLQSMGLDIDAGRSSRQCDVYQVSLQFVGTTNPPPHIQRLVEATPGGLVCPGTGSLRATQGKRLFCEKCATPKY